MNLKWVPPRARACRDLTLPRVAKPLGAVAVVDAFAGRFLENGLGMEEEERGEQAARLAVSWELQKVPGVQAKANQLR